MNPLPTFSRACAHHNLPIRTRAINPLQASQRQRQQQQQRQQKLQSRHLTTSSRSHAQPIELISQTTPASPSETSTITSSILSRATIDTTRTAAAGSTPHPSSSKPQSSSHTVKPLQTTSPFLSLGTVTRTGTMTSTIQLTRQLQTFDPFLRKHYTRPHRLLAHDPNPAGFLREGDIVEFGLFSEAENEAMESKRVELEQRLIGKGVIRLRTRKGKERKLADVGVKRRSVKWVVRRVVTPFGVAVEER